MHEPLLGRPKLMEWACISTRIASHVGWLDDVIVSKNSLTLKPDSPIIRSVPPSYFRLIRPPIFSPKTVQEMEAGQEISYKRESWAGILDRKQWNLRAATCSNLKIEQLDQ